MREQNYTTRFALMRHATTIWNQKKLIQGWLDSPLAPEGEEQARQWGRVLSRYTWDRILVSSKGRALQTAGIINGSY